MSLSCVITGIILRFSYVTGLRIARKLIVLTPVFASISTPTSIAVAPILTIAVPMSLIGSLAFRSLLVAFLRTFNSIVRYILFSIKVTAVSDISVL